MPTCPVFTRAKIKSRSGILKNLPSQMHLTCATLGNKAISGPNCYYDGVRAVFDRTECYVLIINFQYNRNNNEMLIRILHSHQNRSINIITDRSYNLKPTDSSVAIFI